MTDEQAELVGRTFRHFKMHLRRSRQVSPTSNARSFAKQSHKRVRNLYRLEGFAKDSETLEEMVVYRALYLYTERSTARVVSGCAQPRCSSRP